MVFEVFCLSLKLITFSCSQNVLVLSLSLVLDEFCLNSVCKTEISFQGMSVQIACWVVFF